ncbi:MAG: ATP-binding cassette domain-containing protein [Ilumatobacter sp.]|uniref:ABC transporter ATP-binding protein n=1 Tax=Ilumatobacter sp. TaxID=1967498 RepID=UPI002615B3A0|nr:ATP-binding cassette domain-containing protein [Ilumatobacter sp.]MDJ0767769.1 ATP-binding cassette domain-containing protein [Ilumatobacter sp.]
MPAHVHLDAITRTFGKRTVLAGLDLMAQGGQLAVLGPNGAGKTTLLRCLATVLGVNHGSVRVDGLDPGHEREHREIRRRLGYLPQDVGFARGTRVFDALDHLAVLKEHREERTRRRMVFDVLDRVGLRDRAGDKTEELSGGMQRRLGLAGALLGAPTLLVLDEPAAGLDPDERLRLREILGERRHDMTIVISTHLTDEAAMCDRVVVLDEGAIRFDGTPAQLAARADGCTWVQDGFPPPDIRASWKQADGRLRCLGSPPPGVELVPPRLEDGYLLVRSTSPMAV